MQQKGTLGIEKLEYRARSEKVHCGPMTPAGWSGAAGGDQTREGRCRPGYVIGRLPSSATCFLLRGPSHLLRRPPEFNRKLVESRLVREDAGADAFASICRAAWGYGDLSLKEALNTRRLANTPAIRDSRLGGPLGVLGNHLP